MAKPTAKNSDANAMDAAEHKRVVLGLISLKLIDAAA